MKTSLKNAELVNTVLRKMMMIMFIVGQEMENVNTDHINQEKITMASIRSGIGETMEYKTKTVEIRLTKEEFEKLKTVNQLVLVQSGICGILKVLKLKLLATYLTVRNY